MTLTRPDDMPRINTPELAQSFIDGQLKELRAQIGAKKVLLALSGGVDSSVVAALLIKAVGKQLVGVHDFPTREGGTAKKTTTVSATTFARQYTL